MSTVRNHSRQKVASFGNCIVESESLLLQGLIDSHSKSDAYSNLTVGQGDVTRDVLSQAGSIL